ncbi:hypothetical protein K505DRAFT_322613 [Melanomma pulvis-pyrius CBS 109.77]|uniref:Uncharacterized protein n=1 Tax=Melanomma pulvis-pyrius CBS 109.77 TaxID=1314802 RepID=A0A6A6XMM7_9PLEO|nr:hypothetical protein K505DRAFT_322613 [Melanomma pulvis-pyrius CBS 109.77]
MLFNTSYLALILCISTFSNGLPLEGALKPHGLSPRAKSYSIVNVDGGSTSTPSEATTIVEEKTKTKTVKVTDVAPTVTNTVTTTVVDPTPTPSPILASSSSVLLGPTTSISHTLVSAPESTPQPPPSSSKKPTEFPKPSVVTIIVTAPAEPTEYYDNGLWHTSYVVKTFETAAVTATLSTISSSAISILPLPTKT